MELKLLKQTEVPLLSRKRVNVEVSFEGATPSEKDIVNNLAQILKTKQELISIRHIYTKYGESKAKVIAHLYNTVEELKSIEEVNKKKKLKEEQTKKQETKTEEKKGEAKEQPQQESKAEEKKEDKKEDGKEEKKE